MAEFYLSRAKMEKDQERDDQTEAEREARVQEMIVRAKREQERARKLNNPKQPRRGPQGVPDHRA